MYSNQFRYHRSDFCNPQCIFSIQQRFLYSAIDFFTTGVISVFHNTFLYCRNDFCTPRNISLLQERFLYSTIDFITTRTISVFHNTFLYYRSDLSVPVPTPICRCLRPHLRLRPYLLPVPVPAPVHVPIPVPMLMSMSMRSPMLKPTPPRRALPLRQRREQHIDAWQTTEPVATRMCRALNSKPWRELIGVRV